MSRQSQRTQREASAVDPCEAVLTTLASFSLLWLSFIPFLPLLTCFLVVFCCSHQLHGQTLAPPAAAANGSANKDISTLAQQVAQPGNALPSGAVKPSSREAPLQLGFRRVFVPSGDESAWPRANEPLVPVASEEFEKLLQTQAIRQRVNDPIQQADYTAEVRDGVLQGHFTWKLNEESASQGWVRFGRCEYSLDELAGETEQGEVVNVPWGLDSAGELVSNVQGCAKLRGKWRVAGAQNPYSGLDFACELPRCMRGRLELVPPEHLRWALAGAGDVLQDYPINIDPTSNGAGSAAENNQTPTSEASERDARVMQPGQTSSPSTIEDWRGGLLLLRTAPFDQEFARALAFGAVREQSIYRVRGGNVLECQSTFRFLPSSFAQPVEIHLPKLCKPRMLRLGDAETPWKLSDTGVGLTIASVIPASKIVSELRLDYHFDTPNSECTIPRPRLASHRWSDGSIELQWQADIHIESCQLDGARVNTWEDNQASLVLDRPEAAITFVWGPPPNPLTLEALFVGSISENSLTLQCQLQVVAPAGAEWQFPMQLLPGWEFTAPAAPADSGTFALTRRYAQSDSASEQEEWSLRGQSNKQGMRLSFSAKRPWLGRITLQELMPIAVPANIPIKHYLGLRPTDLGALRFKQPWHVPVADLDDLPEVLRVEARESNLDLLMRWSQEDSAQTLVLETPEAVVDVVSRTTLKPEEKGVRATTTIDVTPRTGGVSSLVLQYAGPLTTEPTWTIADASTTTLQVEFVSSGQTAVRLLMFSPPLTRSLRLVSSFPQAFASGERIPLPRFVGVRQQDFFVTLPADCGSVAFTYGKSVLAPNRPNEVSGAEPSTPFPWLTFQLSGLLPPQEVPPALIWKKGNGEVGPWIAREHHTWREATSDEIEGRSHFEVGGNGSQSITLVLPSRVMRVRSLVVNAQELWQPQLGQDTSEPTITLPASLQVRDIDISYTYFQPALGWFRQDRPLKRPSLLLPQRGPRTMAWCEQASCPLLSARPMSANPDAHEVWTELVAQAASRCWFWPISLPAPKEPIDIEAVLKEAYAKRGDLTLGSLLSAVGAVLKVSKLDANGSPLACYVDQASFTQANLSPQSLLSSPPSERDIVCQEWLQVQGVEAILENGILVFRASTLEPIVGDEAFAAGSAPIHQQSNAADVHLENSRLGLALATSQRRRFHTQGYLTLEAWLAYTSSIAEEGDGGSEKASQHPLQEGKSRVALRSEPWMGDARLLYPDATNVYVMPAMTWSCLQWSVVLSCCYLALKKGYANLKLLLAGQLMFLLSWLDSPWNRLPCLALAGMAVGLLVFALSRRSKAHKSPAWMQSLRTWSQHVVHWGRPLLPVFLYFVSYPLIGGNAAAADYEQLYDVLSPVDEKGAPTGWLHLPRSLWEHIRGAANAPPDVVLESAHYQLVGSSSLTGDAQGGVELHILATFQVWSADGDQLWRTPFTRNNRDEQKTIYVNGRRHPWPAGPLDISLPAGRSHVQIPLQVRLEPDRVGAEDASTSFKAVLAAPQACHVETDSQLKSDQGRNVSIQMEYAWGALWVRRQSAAAQRPSFKALHLLQVRQGNATLTSSYIAPNEINGAFVLLADRELSFLSSSPRADGARSFTGERQAIELQLPIGSAVRSFESTWLLKSSLGRGNLQFPIPTLKGCTCEHFVAIVLNEGMRLAQGVNRESLEPVDTDDPTLDWPGEVKPRHVFRVLNGPADWGLFALPPEEPTGPTADVHIELSPESDQVISSVTWRQSPSFLNVQWEVPQTFEVLSITQKDVAKPVRWSSNQMAGSPRRIISAWPHGASGEKSFENLSVELKGRIKHAAMVDTRPAPIVRVVCQGLTSIYTGLYRRKNARVELFSGAVADAGSLSDDFPAPLDFGPRIASWNDQPNLPPREMVATMSADPPSWRAILLNSVTSTSSGWQGLVRIKIIANGGNVDELVLHLGRNAELLLDDASVDSMILATGDPNVKHIALRPKTPWKQDAELQFRMFQPSESIERGKAPMIALEGASSVNYVSLPHYARAIDSWRTTSLLPSEWPDALRPWYTGRFTKLYRLTANEATAEIAPNTSPMLHVLEVNSTIVGEKEKGLRTLTTAVVEHNQQGAFGIQLEENVKLLAAWVNDVNTAAHRVSEGRYGIALPSNAWPCSITLLTWQPPQLTLGSEQSIHWKPIAFFAEPQGGDPVLPKVSHYRTSGFELEGAGIQFIAESEITSPLFHAFPALSTKLEGLLKQPNAPQGNEASGIFWRQRLGRLRQYWLDRSERSDEQEVSSEARASLTKLNGWWNEGLLSVPNSSVVDDPELKKWRNVFAGVRGDVARTSEMTSLRLTPVPPSFAARSEWLYLACWLLFTLLAFASLTPAAVWLQAMLLEHLLAVVTASALAIWLLGVLPDLGGLCLVTAAAIWTTHRQFTPAHSTPSRPRRTIGS